MIIDLGEAEVENHVRRVNVLTIILSGMYYLFYYTEITIRNATFIWLYQTVKPIYKRFRFCFDTCMSKWENQIHFGIQFRKHKEYTNISY